MKLTEGCIRNIHVPAGKRDVMVFDDDTAGFGIRKFANGKAVYFIKFRVNGVQRKITLGPVVPGVLQTMHAAAVKEMLQGRVGNDKNAVKQAAIDARKQDREASRQAKKHALGVLVEEYLAKRRDELKPRSFEEVERHLRKHWKPLHDRPVQSITRADLIGVIDGIAKASGKTAADRAKAALSTFLGWCVDPKLILNANPAIGIGQRATGGGRERVLTEAELVAIWQACNADDHGHIVRLLMLTGQRREEFGSLAWDEVDADKREIRLPGERTKNGGAHTVPLSDAAMAIFAGLPRREGRAMVFGRGKGGFSGWSQSKARLDGRILTQARKEAEKRGHDPEAVKLAPWTLHDLRRTFATLSAEHDFAEPHIIEAMLNHQSGTKAGIVGIYNRAKHERGKRQLADRYGEHVTALVEGRDSKIVPLKASYPQAG